jgi:hypothetical protein
MILEVLTALEFSKYVGEITGFRNVKKAVHTEVGIHTLPIKEKRRCNDSVAF